MVKEAIYTNLVIVESLTSGMTHGESNSSFPCSFTHHTKYPAGGEIQCWSLISSYIGNT